MHTLARFAVRKTGLMDRQAGQRAFTLIELLTVIAIIAILASITFGVVKGVNERAAIGQAKAELASLAQALEAYKLQYGDYPQTGGKTIGTASISTTITAEAPAWLFSALNGCVGPKLDTYVGKQFIELSRFTLETSNMPTSAGGLIANSILDPWGRRYIYYYKPAGSATAWPSYVLFSAGPDGKENITSVTNGVVVEATTTATATAADNIYANK